MPDRKEHVVIGSASGATVAMAYALSREEQLERILTYGVTGFIGGGIGGCIADRIDPPTSPNHRSVGHSAILTLIACFGKNLKKAFCDCLKWLEDKVKEFEAVAQAFYAALCRMLIGFLIGFVTGHFTHLVSDMQTPAGLPFLF